jgi:hypothetical protein
VRVFENRVLTNIGGPKRVEVGKLHREELCDIYSSTNTQVTKSRRMRLARHVWERRGAYRVLAGKPERNRSLGRPRS